MNREEVFVKNFKAILEATNQGFALEEIVGLPLATEGMLGSIIDNYGKFLIETIFPDRDDVLTDIFWNATITGENMTENDIRKLFKELDTHNG